eukprot:XP_766264.1 hypothetical protein [Theileria parva strain Muguga]
MKILILFLINLLKIIIVSGRNSNINHRDGPIGLPRHVFLRNSKKLMRRHKPKIINEHSAVIDEFNTENSQNIAESESNLDRINDLMKTNQDYNILNFDQMQNYNFDFYFIPEWFNTLPPSLSSTKGFVIDSLSSLAHMGLMSLISTQAFQNAYCSVFSSETEKAICLKNRWQRKRSLH